MQYLALLVALLLIGCSAPVVQHIGPPSSLSTALDVVQWSAQLREDKPVWYACKTDQDCVGVEGDCETSCRRDAMNTVGYSDYVVAYSNLCQGHGRKIIKSLYTKKFCDAGTFRLKEK